ncbi:DUF1702 family protein [Actinocrispum wychmicini]|uniref:DUF1702 family protein n=1 Tax=Actinocrispum wychmicini TaxID=1213861 RepID=UPI003C7C9BC9
MWRKVRRRVLTPGMSETRLDTRGFHEKTPEARRLLETAGEMFLTGYAYAAEAKTVQDAEERLEELPVRFRGFGYEGAGMAFAMRDGLPFGGRLTAQFLASRGDEHVYMVYVGIGWAMARLPRMRWSKASAAATDPLLRWLVLDGYGFHQAYFHTRRYVEDQYVEPDFPWPGGVAGDRAGRVIDQGIGRAMWFVAGTDPDLCATMIEKFAPERQSDLYSGAGLAATYAGGVEPDELSVLWERAGTHRSYVAQAAAFAAEARVRAGLLVPHTEMAAQFFCGMSARDAADVTTRLRPNPVLDGAVPAFEVWRDRIADEFAGLGRG